MTTLFDTIHHIHPNSRAAYREEKPRLNKRAGAILDEVKRGGPGTDRQIAERMGFGHKSAVQPRISDLVRMGYLREVGKERDVQTGKPVRVVGV